MLMLFSFPSFFSSFVTRKALQDASVLLTDERNENNEEKPHRKPELISLISCDSFFSFFVGREDTAGTTAENHAFDGQFWACLSFPSSASIEESQPTVRGHALSRCPLPGWRVAAAPSTPAKAKGQEP